MRCVHPGQFLVLDQQRRGRVINVAQHGKPGGRHAHPVSGESTDELSRRVGVHPPAESLVDRRGQLGQPGRLGSGRHRWRPRPEHPGQQRVMHVGAPGQPGKAHLRGDQAAGRFGCHQHAEPRRALVGGNLAKLLRVRGDQFVQRASEVGRYRIGRVEKGVLRRSPGGAIRRKGCGEAARLPVSAAQQSFGKLHVMAPGHPQAGPQQGRVEARAARPHPAHRTSMLVLGNCCRKILSWNGITQPAAVLGELAEQR
jgi:hypothetical protein